MSALLLGPYTCAYSRTNQERLHLVQEMGGGLKIPSVKSDHQVWVSDMEDEVRQIRHRLHHSADKQWGVDLGSVRSDHQPYNDTDEVEQVRHG